MKVARQFTAWNAFTKKARTVGHGLSWSTDGFAIQVENVPSHPIIPFPTGRVRFLPSPGSKLPGYDHLVPSGQNAFPRPVHKIDSTSPAPGPISIETAEIFALPTFSPFAIFSIHLSRIMRTLY
jgi:hypothetical protein